MRVNHGRRVNAITAPIISNIDATADSNRMRPNAKFHAANRSFADIRSRFFALHPAVIGIGHAVVQRVFALRAPDCGGAFASIAALDDIHAYRAAAGRSGGHRALGLAAGQGAEHRHENEDSRIHEAGWGGNVVEGKQRSGRNTQAGDACRQLWI